MSPDAETSQDAWVPRALRGCVARGAIVGGLALLCLGPSQLPTVGVVGGWACALTFLERWATRRGPLAGLSAAAVFGVTWALTALAGWVALGQLQSGFSRVVWGQGPVAAWEALAGILAEEIVLAAAASVCAAPLALNAVAFFMARDTWEAAGFAMWLNLLGGAGALVLAALAGAPAMAIVYAILAGLVGVFQLAAYGVAFGLESILFPGREQRWGAGVVLQPWRADSAAPFPEDWSPSP